MDSKNIGLFLKELRKEKNLTQEALAEKLMVSSRSVSRWETGSNLPDLSLLIELSQFYGVSISEIIEGKRMNEEKSDVMCVVDYSNEKLKIEKRKIVSICLVVFGLFILVSALSIFPNDSSWSSIYAILGSLFIIVGLTLCCKKKLICIGICIISFFSFFMISDYICVTQFNQVPRFSYLKSYGDNVIEHKTFFYTVIQRNPGTENEIIEIEK
ncbi:MAG: helix-turn-helix transcriptional regulator [Erysipelotrichaceae bacterium]|uniref:helix-turn-helix domain-containing protein n=1 Tax=Floccifex sp. TaxID=2815810 RepID=UPI002A749ACD|nr:helix-turn-helix transcriptional regulator [Floccifex sp.]MDD7280706.1 helix-turn-helix transcriptional regulator [Erysipelotrichaceae bacterium]MDY2959136.1 helix-turn-helix transcriptional regulator [Floccifex sp.]